MYVIYKVLNIKKKMVLTHMLTISNVIFIIIYTYFKDELNNTNIIFIALYILSVYILTYYIIKKELNFTPLLKIYKKMNY